MELIWAVIKLIEYLVVAPVWWLSSYFAAYFYPREGDDDQDLLAMFFALLIYVGIFFALVALW